MKTNQVIKTTVDTAAQCITFEVRGVDEPIVFDLTKVHPDLIMRAALHGFVQRVSDGAAMGRDPLTGASASPADKAANMQRIVAHYMAGGPDWNMTREGGGGRVSYLAEAIAEYKGIPVDEARAFLKDRNTAERNALEYHPPIKAIIDAKRAANVKADAGALLAGL